MVDLFESPKIQLWLWLVIVEALRRIVGWTLGSRGEAPLQRVWQSLPTYYHHYAWLFTNK